MTALPVSRTPGTHTGRADACPLAGRSLASSHRRSDNGYGTRWPAVRYVPHGRSDGTAAGPAPQDRAQRSGRPSPGQGCRIAETYLCRPCPGRPEGETGCPSWSGPRCRHGLAVRIEEASGTEIQRVLILRKDHTGEVILDLPVIIGGIGAVGDHDWHALLGAEHGFALELPTGEVLGVIGGLTTVVNFESHVFPPEIMIVAGWAGHESQCSSYFGDSVCLSHPACGVVGVEVVLVTPIIFLICFIFCAL